MEPSLRFSPLDFRSRRRRRSEFVERLLQQVDKARQLPLLLLRSRTLFLLGSVTPTPGTVYVVVSIAHIFFGIALAVLRFRDVVHDVADSIVQVLKHVRGARGEQNRRRFVIALPVVRTPLFGMTLFGASLFRGTFYFRSAVPADSLRAVLALRSQGGLRR
jgi:hypothetical protein